MSLFRRKQPPAPPPSEHAVIVRFSVSDDSFGNPEERAAFLALEATIAQAIDTAGVGEYDGNMFGNGEVVMYAYGPDADRLFVVMQPYLRGYEARPASCVLRYGPASDPEAPERRVSL